MINKIAIVTRNMHGGGAEQVIAQLIQYFETEKIKNILITIDNESVFYRIPDSTKLIAIGKKSENKIIDRILRYKEVRSVIKDEKVDIVLSMPEDIGIYMIPTLMGSRIPLIVSERNNPWVMPDKKITRLLRKIMYPKLDGIIFQTEMAASFFSEDIRNKGVILQNPLDGKRIPNMYQGERRKEIVGVGRLVEQKNFKLLIEAFSEFRRTNLEYKLVIYGEGRLENELKEFVKDKIPKGSYLFAGKEKKLLEKINGASAFVLTSDYEGMPNVLIEAMAMGMPVISTDCPSGGPKTIIENGQNGLLVRVGDKDGLVEAMQKIIDANYARKLGENALKTRERLSSKEVYERWVQYIEKVAKKN